MVTQDLNPQEKTNTKPKITLYRGFPHPGRYTVSPFVTKLEFRLRHAEIPYTTACGSPTAAPNGKIPYVDFGGLLSDGQGKGEEDGETGMLGDSAVIVKRLVEVGRMVDLNERLSARERLCDRGLAALFEEKLYFFQMRERWIDNYHTQRDLVLHMPYPIRIVVGWLIYRKQSQMLHAQGVGRYTAEQCAEIRNDIWMALSECLEDSRRSAAVNKREEPFWCLGGKEPTECDAAVFGFVVSVLMSPASPDSRDFVRALEVVVDYANRIHDRWFPDYEKWE